MKVSSYRRNTCRLCEGKALDLAFRLAPTPIEDNYVPSSRLGEAQPTFPLDLYLCRDCAHLQLLDVVDPEALFGDYVYVTAVSLGLVEHFRRYCDAVTGRIRPPQGALVVEIGSNDGSLLRFFKQKGLRVLGIDPARAIARQATEAGIETVPAFFTSELARKIRQEHGAAAIVAGNNVFAHSDSLADMADGVRELLADDGVFVFEVSYLVDIVQKLLFDTVYHEHLCYHSVKPLVQFCARHGMELIDVERIPTKGGSLRCTVQRTGGPRPVAAMIGQLLSLEKSLELEKVETFERFAAEIDAHKQALLGLLQDLRTPGKTVAGYGASATVTTLMYHFDLGDKLSFLVDDNPRKQGTYSPGHHIPVLPPRALLERKPDYVVILAWNYARPIIEKNQAYRQQGGGFIVPLPQLEVS